MSTAYLVALIQTDVTPPVVVDVGVYSERATSLTSVSTRVSYAGLFEYEADTYHEAHEALLEAIQSKMYRRWFEWTFPFLGIEE